MRVAMGLFGLAILLLSRPVHSIDAAVCGEPPPVADETLKGEIQGEAQLLTRFLGDASLSGKIATSRKDFFIRYGQTGARSDAIFSICSVY